MISEACRAANKPPEAGDLRYGRSRLSNGSQLLPGIDGRSAWVRRCKDLITDHIADLGGLDNVSVAERSIVRRCAVLTTELERLEAVFAVNDAATPDQLDLYQRTAGNLRRLLEAVGLQRRQRDVTPTLRQLLMAEAADDGSDEVEVVVAAPSKLNRTRGSRKVNGGGVA